MIDRGDSLSTDEVLARFKLIPDRSEVGSTVVCFRELVAFLERGKPDQQSLSIIFQQIWNAARVAGALQMRRSIVDTVDKMAEKEIPAAGAWPEVPPPVIVEALERDWCSECAKESS